MRWVGKWKIFYLFWSEWHSYVKSLKSDQSAVIQFKDKQLIVADGSLNVAAVRVEKEGKVLKTSISKSGFLNKKTRVKKS